MGRPRKDPTNNLPPAVVFKNGAFYFIRKNEWIRLTSDRDKVDAALAAIHTRIPASQQEIADYARRLVARSRSNAKGRRALAHELTYEDVLKLLWDADWRCAVTATPFSLVEVGPRKQRPYAPSIDRIDNSLGYVQGNCRMVCTAANYAMNTWGEEVLRHLARNIQRAKF